MKNKVKKKNANQDPIVRLGGLACGLGEQCRTSIIAWLSSVICFYELTGT